MRVSNEEKARSRDRIVAAAARLFRERGIDGASVGDIMAAAGLTHGGFYRHFADKEALVAASLGEALETFASPLLDEAADAGTARCVFVERYLSDAHRAHPGEGCPVAALGPEVARSGETVRDGITSGVARIVDGLARADGAAAGGRDDALRDLATLVGGVILARALNGPLADEVVAACKKIVG